MRHRPLQTLALLPPMAAGLVLMAPLGLTDGLIAGAALAQTQPRGQAQGKGAEPDTRSFIGAWALTDNRNNLFNVRLFPGGRAVSTVGAEGVPAAGASRLSPNEMRELGRWQPWGNGVRIDYGDGWTDWIYVGPDGLSHAAWQPGQSRGSVPFNFGPAVKLSGVEAQVVGVYSFPPAQAELKPYTATLLSNGQAFNDIDNRGGGVWQLKGSSVVIDWISGWRTTMSLDPGTPLQLRHWAPGADRNGPETGGVRQGKRIE
jgi:hypothetical protein